MKIEPLDDLGLCCQVVDDSDDEGMSKDIRNQLLVSLREAFKMLLFPDSRNPYLLVGIGTGSDGCEKIMTVLTNIHSNPWQDTDVTYLGTVDLSRYKPEDSDSVLAKYENRVNEYVDGLKAE